MSSSHLAASRTSARTPPASYHTPTATMRHRPTLPRPTDRRATAPSTTSDASHRRRRPTPRIWRVPAESRRARRAGVLLPQAGAPTTCRWMTLPKTSRTPAAARAAHSAPAGHQAAAGSLAACGDVACRRRRARCAPCRRRAATVETYAPTRAEVACRKARAIDSSTTSVVRSRPTLTRAPELITLATSGCVSRKGRRARSGCSGRSRIRTWHSRRRRSRSSRRCSSLRSRNCRMPSLRLKSSATRGRRLGTCSNPPRSRSHSRVRDVGR
mmetsp:Transcript_75560/g.208541  ORF Transcript_75560/g.208541 Transcript_75560/m.208541 type:complete len:270 (+) Transcript_75560:644-1453(+)